ncbi:cytochrome c-type biogenesis protein CcmH [Hyphomicrobium sp. LHD-15]|uniref:cytochrome c-type biogenesis protein n=1 Tax=Hyphomicrobium sp. LHD-15 TaxID=3072142 RepID=UPI00280CBF4A|nr:cytochrome c-type biogenesis protein CcmH [Hyphomicrobium sp. LHD-15]MDQ8697252.1 cytochrome c-type biogenesis protein CcmH [Hyphomicrobium sp. LHD-15]
MRAALSRIVMIFVGCVLLASGAAQAVTPQEILPDKALEARARDISAGLRCLVCQNQSIDDSDAPLAHDLRVLVRERLTAGDSDTQVREFVVARYGDFVLLKPPFSAATLLLWLMPLLALAGAALILWNSFGQPTRTSSAAPSSGSLSADEQAALDALLRKDEPGKS